MIDIMIQISSYIFLAILLGFTFGWLIRGTSLKEPSKEASKTLPVVENRDTIEVSQEMRKLKDEIYEYKKENKLLRAKNKELSFGYNGQQYVLDEHNATLDEFQKRLLSKDEIIDTLTRKLSSVEEEQRQEVKRHEEEIAAFMLERIDITQKYKELREKYHLLQKSKGIYPPHSWIAKWFASPLKV